MRGYMKLAAAAAILVTSMSGAAEAAPISKTMPKMTRIGGKPNLNGIWQVMNGANWNLEPHDAQEAPAASDKLGAIAAIPAGVGVVEGGQIPYKPEALKQRDENRGGVPGMDPEAACYLPGIPRATYMNYPFQIVQAENGDILMVYEYDAANRVIHMGPVGVPPIDTWMGTSYGTWEGDTLKVTTLAENPGDVIAPGGALKPGVTWLDRAGNFLTGQATITERFRPDGPDRMMYEVTVDDPTTFSRPWKMTMTIYRHVEPNAQLLDFRCVPFADKLLYGDLLKDKDKYPKK